MKIAMVFPGQGSQAVGMLKGYAGLPEIDAVRAEATAVLGADFVRIVDEGPAESLNQTVNTQPAMVMAGIAAYRAWRARGGPAPELVAGHSLGEYSALVAAESLAFGDALPLVRFRAQAMQDAVPAGVGAMAAVLNLSDDETRAACSEAAQGQVVEAVNFNGPGQIVIAGHAEAVARASESCKKRGARRVVPLPVSAPFHSSLMQPAAEKLRGRLAGVNVRPTVIGLLNNVDVKTERDPEGIKQALVRQAASPVRWADIIHAMALAGVTHVIECGPGKVLAGMTRRIEPSLQSFALADRESLEQALSAVQGGTHA